MYSGVLTHYRRSRTAQQSLLNDSLRIAGALTVVVVLLAVLWMGIHLVEP